MVLPDISGSTIFLIFGLYGPILNGVKVILKVNFVAPTSLEIPKLPMSIDSFSIVFFVIGYALVPVL